MRQEGRPCGSPPERRPLAKGLVLDKAPCTRSEFLGSRLAVCGGCWEQLVFQCFSGAEAKPVHVQESLAAHGADHPGAWMGRAAGRSVWKGPWGRFLPVLESVLADGFPSFLLARNGLLGTGGRDASSLFEAFPVRENTKEATFAFKPSMQG